MADNNQGFAAVVSAIERLRDTAYNNTGLRVSVSRARLLEERKQTTEIKKLANENRQLRDKQGRFAKEQNGLFKNLMSGRGVTGKGYTKSEAKQAALAAQKGTAPGKFKRMSEAEAKAAALEIAKSTNDGFQKGLNQGNAGESFGESFLKSFKDSLGINSPSKEAEKLAGYFVQGWEIGLKGLSISTDAALEEQGKRFRRQLRKTIIQSREQPRDKRGRYTKPKPDPATNENYWSDTSHAVVNAQQNALQALYVRDAGPAVQDKMRAIFGDEAKEEAEIRKEIRRRKKSLIKQIQKESELSAEEQQRLEESRLSRKVLSPKQRLAYLQTVEKRPELIKEYGEVSAMYPNKRNVEELAALRYYTKPAGYKEMNMPLRGLTKEYQDHLKEKGINRTQKRITKESTLNTDLAIGALNKMPGYEGTTYRGLTLSDEDIEAIQTGGTYKEKGFFSTTKNKQQRYPGNVVFEIKSNKRGKDVSEIEAYANNEVLFAPNSEFNVANKRKVERLGQTFWVIELEDKNPGGAEFVGGIPQVDITKPVTQPQAKKVKPKTLKKAIAGEESRGGNITEINTRAVFITAETVTIEQSGKEPDPGQETEKITDELQKLREDIKTNGFSAAIGSLFRSVATGLAIAFAQSMKDDFFAGFKGGVKERSNFDFTDAGASVGRFVANPLASAKETVKARKEAKLDDSLAQAEQMARREDVQIQDGKVKVYTAGGLGGPGLEDFTESLRSIGIDPDTADIENTFNPNSSTDIPLSDPLRFAGDALLNKYVKNEFIDAQNRDAIKLAAKVIAARKKDPNAKINLVGHSGGADIVQQAIAILEKGGYAENVQGIGVGGIDIGTGFDTENFVNVAGDDDYVVKATGPLGSQATARDFGQVSKLGSHKVAEYFKHPDFIKSLDQSLQPNAVATILDQYYEQLIQEYGDDALPLLEEFLRDGQKFAEEFNQQFGEEETARINDILARYNAKRVEIAGDGVRHGGIKAKPQTPPTVGQTIRTEADRLTVQLISALRTLTDAVNALGDRLLNREPVQETPAANYTPGAVDDPWEGSYVDGPVRSQSSPPREIPIDWQDDIEETIETDAQRKSRQARDRMAQAEIRELDRQKRQRQLAQDIANQDSEIQQLKEQYIIYLGGLVERAKREAPRQVQRELQGRFRDSENVSSESKAVLADQKIRGIEAEMGRFRSLEAEGDYVGMMAEAERLIPQIEQARQLHKDSGRIGSLAGTRNQRLDDVLSELLQGSTVEGKARVGVVSALNLNTKAIAQLINAVRTLTNQFVPARMDAGAANTYANQLGIDVPNRRSPVPDVQRESESIQDRFTDFLRQFIEDARAAAESQVELLMAGFRGLSTQGKKEFAKSFSDQIKSKAAEYRTAIANGQRELANSLGLSLIRQVASTRKIYDTILSDPSSQNMGRRSIQGMKGYLSQVENEVISGQPNMKGRSPDGLIQNLDKAIEAAEAGDETAQGFLNALDASLQEFEQGGANAGNATLDGLDESLDMHSPSEEMRKRGEMAGAGFEIGLVKSLKDAGQAAKAEINKLKATIAKDLEYFRAVATGDTAKAQAMVEQTAKGSGYNVGPVYHGSPSQPFYEFDENLKGNRTGAEAAKKAWFASSSEQVAGSYRLPKWEQSTVLGDDVYETIAELQEQIKSQDQSVQQKAKSQLDLITKENAQKINDATQSRTLHRLFLRASDPLVKNQKNKNQYQNNFDAIITSAQKKGKDSVIFNNAQDGLDTPELSSIFAFFRSNQVKLADPITQTDDGKPVPLSARFDDSVSDIRGNVTDIFAGLKAQAGEALQPLIAELETSFAAMGDNSVQSLIDSLEKIMGQLRGAGEDVGDTFAEGTEDSLEINSPSKRMQDIAEWAMKGFARGVNESGDLIRDQLSVVLDKMEQIPFLGWFVKVGRQAVQFFEKLMGRPERGYKDEWMDLFDDLYLEQETVEVKVKPDIQEPDKPVTTQTQAIAGEEDQKQLPGGHIGQKLIGAIADAKETVQDQVLTLQESYAVYLKDLMDRAGEAIAEAGLDKGELTSQVEEFRNRIKADLGHFRQAVAEGSNILALQVGEGILAKTAAVKEMFGELGQDATGTEKRSLAGKKGAATKQQNEVIKGGTTKNAAPKGLWEIVGEDTTEGFIQALRAKIDAAREAGVDFSLAAYEGAKEALKIESPSKMFADLAQWCVDGFIGPFRANTGAVEEVGQDIGEAVTEGTNEGIKRFGDDAENNIVEFRRTASDQVQSLMAELREKISQLPEALKQLPASITAFAGAVGAAIAVFTAVKVIGGALGQLAAVTFDTIVAFEGLERSFIALSGGSVKARQNMEFVRQAAQDLGIDLKTAEEAYKGLLATTRGTALEGVQTEQMFKAFSETASVRGLNNEEQGRMFAAITQALSKQKLSAEEVRGQLGELAGLDFQGTLARSMGISVAQLDEAMSSGSLMAADVLPKVAAQYAAENAIVANSSETTAQAIARYNNEIELIQRRFVAFGEVFRPLYNGLAQLINWFSGAIPGLIELVSKLALALSLQLIPAIFKSQIIVGGLKVALNLLRVGFLALGKAILANIGPFLLFSLALDAIAAAINVTQNRFAEYAKAVDTTRKAVEAMEKAQAKLNKTQSQAGKNLPTKPGEVVTDQTWKPFGVDVKPLAEKIGVDGNQGFLQNAQKFARFGPLALLGKSGNLEGIRQSLGLTTLGEKQMNDFKITASENSDLVNRVYAEGSQVVGEVEKITEIDRQLAIVRSRRFENIRGDKQAYEQSVEAEKELLAKREEILAYTSTYQTSLDSAITSVEQRLRDIEGMKARGGITQDEAEYQTTMAEAELEDLKKARTEFEKLSNALTQSVNGLEREMRNLNEQTTAFNEALERNATNNRVQFLRQAAANGTGSTVRGMGLNALQNLDNQARVGFLRDRLSTQEMLLSDPEFAAIAEELRQQAAALGTDLENTATLDRIIAENRDGTTTQVATLIKEILDTKTQLGQAEEAIAQSIIDQRSELTDLNRTIADFFQQLTQQFEEARIELDRVKNQLKYGGLKQKLQRALVPGSNSFINGIIGSIQGIFDQAASVMESVLVQRQSRLSFAGEKYSLDNQMTDFARSVNGATQAVEAFRQSLAGGQSTLNNAGQSGAVATRRGGGGVPSASLINQAVSAASKFNGIVNMCAAAVKAFSDVIGINTKVMDLTADSAKKAGKVMTDFSKIKPGDIIGWSGGPRFGDEHVGVYLGGNQVFHQSGARGKKVGVYDDFDYFKKQRGAYFVRPNETSFNQTAIAGNAGGSDRQAIANLLKRFNSQMTPDDFYAVSQATGVQVDALVTQAMIESGFGTTGRGRRFNNPLNWGNDDAGNNMGFPSLRAGLMAGAQGLKRNFNFTSPEQFMSSGFKGKYGIYATDPQYKQKYQAALNQVRSAGIGGSVAPVATNVSTTTQPQPQIIASTPDPVIARAQQLTNQVVGVESAIVDGNGLLVKQQIDQLLLQIQQEKQAIERQSIDGIRMAGNTIAESRDAFADLMDQYSPQTLTSQAAAELRQVNATVRQQQNELFERRREQEDTISAARRTIEKAPELIAELQDPAKNIDPVEAIANKAQIDLINSTVQAFQNDLIPAYEKALAVTKQQETELKTLETTMQSWLQTQAKQRQLNQDGEMIALRASVAQASFNEQLKLTADLQAVDNEFEKQRLQLQLQLSDQPELLKEVLSQLEQERDAKKQNLQYDFDALIRGRELEALSRRLGVAQTEFNLEKTLSLEIAQAELEAENNRLKILQEIRDEAEQSRQLELNDAEKLQKIRQSELNYINAYLDRKQADRDLDSRITENAANLSRNPFAATQLREQNAVANRQMEFERRAEEIRQTQPADRAASMIAYEAEILAQDLELIDREFRDLSETIGDNIGSAFMAFSDALINGDNALQAFTNSLLKAVSDIGSQLMQQGIQGLMQSVFGKSGAIGGLFGGGASSGLGSFGGQALVSGLSIAGSLAGGFTGATAMLPFADGGYTGDGGKWEPKGIVHGGEFVINKEATRKIGLPALMSANALGQLPGYATGGYVGSVESRLLSGLNSTRMPSISLPSENRRSPVTAGPVSNTVTVNINDRESRFYRQSRTLARDLADQLRS